MTDQVELHNNTIENIAKRVHHEIVCYAIACGKTIPDWVRDGSNVTQEVARNCAKDVVEIIKDSAPLLPWSYVEGGAQSQGRFHFYKIYENNLGSFTLDDGESFSAHGTMKLAQEAAHQNHTRNLMEEFGL